jgi:hypothetical protein
MTSWAIVLLLAAAPQQTPEPKPVPKDSVEIVAIGCLKGRAFTATAPRQEADVARGPDVTGRTFRINAKRPVMDDVKKHNGHLVEIAGLVRTSALADNRPGRRIGNTRVIIGSPPPSTNPAGIDPRAPLANVVILDATAVRFVSEECPIR